MFCNKCGQELKDEMQFCIKCGNKVQHLSIETETMPKQEKNVTINESVKKQRKKSATITKKEFLKNCSPKVKSWVKKSWILYFIGAGLTLVLFCALISAVIISEQLIEPVKEEVYSIGESDSEGESYESSLIEGFHGPTIVVLCLLYLVMFVSPFVLGALTCKTKSVGVAISFCIFASLSGSLNFFLPFAIPILVFMCKINKEYSFFANV